MKQKIKKRSVYHYCGVLKLLHHRVNLVFPSFFVKVRAHRGEPYNEAADRGAILRFSNDTVKKFIKTRQLCPTYTPLVPLGSRNIFFDPHTVAEIFWVHVCLSRHSPKKLRNVSCNQMAANFLAVLSSTSGVKRTLPIALSVTRENPWVIFRAAVSSWKSHALLLTT